VRTSRMRTTTRRHVGAVRDQVPGLVGGQVHTLSEKLCS
jgi:hypothetical protein